MTTLILRYVLLSVATFPFIYYLLVLFSSWRFFHRPAAPPPRRQFTPPVSNIKPIRGSDPEAYQNFLSFCRQDYPEYEVLFCLGEEETGVVPMLEQLARDYPQSHVRIFVGSQSDAPNDKVAKLARLVSEARHEVLVMSDSDVRAQPDYLRTVVAPLADPRVGAVTCLYVPIEVKGWAENLQRIGMVSDFYAGILVARQLDGVKFALGPTIATTRTRLAAFGGYRALENGPADDLLVGRFIAEQGYEVELLPHYTVPTVPDYQSFSDLLHKRLRWLVVMRHMRPWGHLGLLFTEGLPWSLAALALRPSAGVAAGYLGAYLGLRLALTWLIGVRGLGDKGLWRQLWLIPVWDALAFLLWLASFTRNTFHWRGADYLIRDGRLVATTNVTKG